MSATSEYRIAFKAGRAFRRSPTTNFVDPDARKGAIILQNGDDGLLHFIWKNRSTNEAEEDLILFPGDASFVKVPQSSWGRTYILKFSSSSDIHFFWMQDADESRDAEFVENVNRLLQDPEAVPIWPASTQAASTSGGAPSSSSTRQLPPGVPAPPPALNLTRDEVIHLRRILGQGGPPIPLGVPPAQPTQNAPDYLLQDILTPANLLPLFTSHPEVLPALFPFLPPDLPVPPSAEVLSRIVGSPQFRSAVRSFDLALASGALGGFVRALGLPEDAGYGFEAFLQAVAEQARRQGGEGSSGSGTGASEQGPGGDRMDTD